MKDSDISYIERSEYHKAREEVTERLSSIKGVKSVYGFGEVSAPGISDIDFYLVLEEPVDSEKLESETKDLLSKYRIFGHPPDVLTEETFRNLPLISPFNNLRHRHGEDYDFAVSKDNSTARSLIFFDVLFKKWFTGPLNFIAKNHYPYGPDAHMKYLEAYINIFIPLNIPSYQSLNPMLVLCRLHGMKHNKILAEEAFGVSHDFKSIPVVEDLRQNFFDPPRPTSEELVNAAELALEDSYNLLKKCMEEQETYHTSYEGQQIIEFQHFKAISSNWDEVEPSDYLDILDRYGLETAYLPPETAVHLNRGGKFSMPNVSGDVSEEADEMISKRKTVMKNLEKFKRRNNLEFLGTPTMMSSPPSNGLKNQVKNYIHRRILRHRK